MSWPSRHRSHVPHERPGIHEHLVADLRAGRARTERLDLAGHVGAEAMRELVLEVGQAAPRPQVDVIERDGAHADAHLARAGLGELDRGALEHLGAPRRAHDHRFGLHRDLTHSRTRAPSGQHLAWASARRGRHGVRQRERHHQHAAIDRVHVVDVDVTCVAPLAGCVPWPSAGSSAASTCSFTNSMAITSSRRQEELAVSEGEGAAGRS